MNHDWKVVIVGEGQMPVEPRLLVGKRSAVPVAVEAGFSDGNNAWPCDHFQDGRPILRADFRRVVGVNTDCGEDPPMFCCELERAGA